MNKTIIKMRKAILVGVVCALFCYQSCSAQAGPDPWHSESKAAPGEINNDLPPDLRINLSKKHNIIKDLGTGEWFYRRILSIIMKGGNYKENEDGSVDILLQLKLSAEQWQTLQEYTTSPNSLTEDMFRRSLGYIEQAIYHPYIATKLILSWSDYLVEYRVHLTWGFAALATLCVLWWLRKNMSHNHYRMIIFIVLYIYEVFTSYKEAEKQDLEIFLAAINRCKWKFWSSTCELPMPDPLLFIKHMSPLRILIRMFATVITEPLISMSGTLKVVVHGVTDDLWYPVDKIAYGILIVVFNVLILFLIIMIIFNFILNIPFSLDFLWVRLATHRRRDSRTTGNQNAPTNSNNAENRISDAAFSNLLQYLQRNTPARNRQQNARLQIAGRDTGMRRRKNAKPSKLINLKAYVQTKEATEMSSVRTNANLGSGDN